MIRTAILWIMAISAVLWLAGCGSSTATPTPTATTGSAATSQPTATLDGSGNTPAPTTQSTPTATPTQGPPYYQGKTIRIVTPGSPGGGYDYYSRLLARYLPKYIPGNPQVIVQNMPGGNTALAPNFVYNAAPKDGTYISQYVPNLYIDQILGKSYVKFDAKQWVYLGSPTYDNSVEYCNASVVDQMTPQQIAQAQKDGKVKSPLIEVSQEATQPQFALLALETGLQIKLVTGYAASAEVNQALRSGEGDCAYSTFDSAIQQLHDMYVNNELDFIGQLGAADGSRASDIPNTPTLGELANTPVEQLLVNAVLPTAVLGRPFVAAPGIPDAAAAVLKDGVWKAMNDAGFVEGSKKESGVANPVTADEQNAAIQKVFSASPQDMTTIKNFFENGVVPGQ